ncbi:MAG: DUF1207 domain-containing protein [Nitrospirota bacterium]|nr:DUF1207 domain-containing protein [Nitrospirota bacterium]
MPMTEQCLMKVFLVVVLSVFTLLEPPLGAGGVGMAAGMVPDNVTLDQDPEISPSSPQSGMRTILFPSQDVFTPLLADPRQPTSAVQFFTVSNNAYGQFNGTFGGDFGIVRFESPTEGVNRSLQIGVMGAAFNRFGFFGSSTYLIDADYVIGLPVTIRFGKFSGRIFFYHESSHTGYNFTRLSGLNKLSDFGQELLQVIPSYDVTPQVRIFAGFAYRVVDLGYYSSFRDSTIGLTGFELYSDPLKALFGSIGRAYAAFYLESRGINGFSPNEDVQAGFLLHRPGSYFQIRPAIDFYNGFSPMGDLLFTRDQYLGLGLYFDY